MCVILVRTILTYMLFWSSGEEARGKPIGSLAEDLGRGAVAHLADGGAEDELDLGRADVFLVGGFGEGEGEVDAGAGADAGVAVADIDADVAVGEGLGEADEVVGVDEGLVLERGELAGAGESGGGGEGEKGLETFLAGGEVGGGKASARKAADGEAGGIGQFFADREGDGFEGLIEEGSNRIEPFGELFGPDVERLSGGKVIFVPWKSEGEDADLLAVEELHRLVEGVEAKTVRAGKGEVEEGRERAEIERGSCMVKGEMGADRESGIANFRLRHGAALLLGCAAAAVSGAVWDEVLRRFGSGARRPCAGQTKPRSKGCRKGGVPAARRRAI